MIVRVEKKIQKHIKPSNFKICSSYDNECIDVPDFNRCVMGYMPCGGILSIADGHCPMLDIL